MTILVQQLRELCDKATQGDWWIDSHGRQLVAHNPFSSIFITHGEAMGPATRHPETGYLSHWPNDWDASYIVAVQPKVVRGLLDEIDRLTRAAKYCEDIDATHENHRETMLYDMAVERDQLKAENAELIDLMRCVVAEHPRRSHKNDGNGPGHGHAVPGVWDEDNGELAGKPCAWCSIWNAAKGIVERHEQAMPKEGL